MSKDIPKITQKSHKTIVIFEENCKLQMLGEFLMETVVSLNVHKVIEGHGRE